MSIFAPNFFMREKQRPDSNPLKREEGGGRDSFATLFRCIDGRDQIYLRSFNKSFRILLPVW
jgi:hypothetical protein